MLDGPSHHQNTAAEPGAGLGQPDSDLNQQVIRTATLWQQQGFTSDAALPAQLQAVRVAGGFDALLVAVFPADEGGSEHLAGSLGDGVDAGLLQGSSLSALLSAREQLLQAGALVLSDTAAAIQSPHPWQCTVGQLLLAHGVRCAVLVSVTVAGVCRGVIVAAGTQPARSWLIGAADALGLLAASYAGALQRVDDRKALAHLHERDQLAWQGCSEGLWDMDLQASMSGTRRAG